MRYRTAEKVFESVNPESSKSEPSSPSSKLSSPVDDSSYEVRVDTGKKSRTCANLREQKAARKQGLGKPHEVIAFMAASRAALENPIKVPNLEQSLALKSMI